MRPAPKFVERTTGPRGGTGETAPLLVLLHGIGADENDLFPLARAFDPRFRVVSLRAPHRYSGGWAWFHIDLLPGGRVIPDTDQARETLADFVRWVEVAPTRLGTDPKRTFLLGFSQGAMMALGVLRAMPERLAGVVALSGRDPAALVDHPASPDAVARVPLLIAHGTLDDVLPVENGRQARDAFSELSRDFTYHEFAIGHAIGDDELAVVASWLAAHL